MMRLREVKVASPPTPNIDSLSQTAVGSYKEVADSHNSAAENIHIKTACQLNCCTDDASGFFTLMCHEQ